MKKIYFLSIVSLLLVSQTSLFAQSIPKNANEISPLLVGEMIPESNLETLEGTTITLKEITSKKPTVLVMFRGGWCPYCNAQLIDLRKSLTAIDSLGFQLVAISPDSFKKSRENLQKNNLNFTLLSDLDRTAMIGFGIAYQAPTSVVKEIKTYSEGKNLDLIPVPSVYVISQKGEILFEYINPDFTTRISSKLLLSVLKGL